MKKITAIFLVVMLSGCTKTNKKITLTTDEIVSSVIIDVTDPQQYWVSPQAILNQYHFQQTPQAACVFRMRVVSEIEMTPVITYRLGDASETSKQNLSDDPQHRNKCILAFNKSILKVFENFYLEEDTARSKENSEIFRVVCNELNFLMHSKGQEKVLTINSNLIEHSDLANFYQLATSDPGEIAKLLEQHKLLPEKLTGLNIFLVFHPKDREEDKWFRIISQAYKLLFEKRGAEVHIQARL